MPLKSKVSDAIKDKLKLLKILNRMADKDLYHASYLQEDDKAANSIEANMRLIDKKLDVLIKEAAKKIEPEGIEIATNAQKKKLLHQLKKLNENYGIDVQEINFY